MYVCMYTHFQYLEQRKRLHTSMLTSFKHEITSGLRTLMESNDVKDRLKVDAFCKWNKHHVELQKSIIKEVWLCMRSNVCI